MRFLLEGMLRRPIAVTAFYILLTALSVMALIRLPVELLPSLSYPSLVVWTSWPEVPPEQVERSVTRPVEDALAGIPGISSITAKSQLGGSLVRVDFGWNTDLDFAALDVRQKLDRLTGLLPQRAERPLVLRVNPGDRPMLVIALGSRDASQQQTSQQTPQQTQHQTTELVDLEQIGEDVIARRLEQLSGVARVRVTGGYEREIRVQLEDDRLAAYGLTLADVETALANANVSLAGGTIQKGPFRYALEVSGEFQDIAAIANTVVSKPGAATIRLSEIGQVKDGVARRRGLVRVDDREVLLLLVERRPDANTVHAAAAARDSLETLRAEVPGVSFEVLVDESIFIKDAIGGVAQALVWGGILAVAIMLIFLRRLRTLAAVALAVPLSLVVALVLFDLLGVTLNLISLSGLALGVGLLVDNAIVVVENIARLREQGLPPREAAARGASEVSAAITTSTLTTLAVFVPLIFVEGLAGRLFRDQSLAVVCSVGASLLVGLTVVPLVLSREEHSSKTRKAQAGSMGLGTYEKFLDRSLTRPLSVLAACLIFVIAAGWLAFALPRETVPETDEGRLSVQVTLPAGADLSWLSTRSRDLETALTELPEVERVLADLGERDDARLDLDPRPSYRGDLTVLLEPGASTDQVLRSIANLDISDDLTIEARPVKPQLEALLVAEDADLMIDLVSEDRSAALASVPELMQTLQQRSELSNVARSDPASLPAYDLRLDWDTVARLGAQTASLDGYLEAATRGREATRLRKIRDEVPIVLHSQPTSSPEELLAKRIPVAAGFLPLGNFFDAQAVALPAVLLRAKQAPVVRLLADLTPGFGLQDALAAIDSAVAAAVPAQVQVRVGGTNEAFLSSVRAVGVSLLLSVALVYLILAAQFESLVQPLIVLSVVPLAIAGVGVTLALTGHSWNLMSMTGCVVLVGIAVNDAIIKVDFINQRRRAGMSIDEAVRSAGHDRFRPIVMTTLTTALGLLPLALGLGAGGSLRAPLAVAITGGLLFSTGLTLSVLPSLYRALGSYLPQPYSASAAGANS